MAKHFYFLGSCVVVLTVEGAVVWVIVSCFLVYTIFGYMFAQNHKKYGEFSGYWLTQLPSTGLNDQWKFEKVMPGNLFNLEHMDDCITLASSDSEDYEIHRIEYLDKTSTEAVSEHESVLGCSFKKKQGILKKNDFLEAGFVICNGFYTLPKFQSKLSLSNKTRTLLNHTAKGKVNGSQPPFLSRCSSCGTVETEKFLEAGSENKIPMNKRKPVGTLHRRNKSTIKLVRCWLDEIPSRNKEQWRFKLKFSRNLFSRDGHELTSVVVVDSSDDDDDVVDNSFYEIERIQYMDNSLTKTVLQHESKLNCSFKKKAGVITNRDFLDAGFLTSRGTYTLAKLNSEPSLSSLENKTCHGCKSKSSFRIKKSGLPVCSKTTPCQQPIACGGSSCPMKGVKGPVGLKQNTVEPGSQSLCSDIKSVNTLGSTSKNCRKVQRFWLDELLYGTKGRRKFRKIIPGKFLTAGGHLSACVTSEHSEDEDLYEIERIEYLDKSYTETVLEHERELGCIFKKKDGIITKQDFLEAGFLITSGIYISPLNSKQLSSAAYSTPRNLDNKFGTVFHFEVSSYDEYISTVQPLDPIKKQVNHLHQQETGTKKSLTHRPVITTEQDHGSSKDFVVRRSISIGGDSKKSSESNKTSKIGRRWSTSGSGSNILLENTVNEARQIAQKLSCQCVSVSALVPSVLPKQLRVPFKDNLLNFHENEDNHVKCSITKPKNLISASSEKTVVTKNWTMANALQQRKKRKRTIYSSDSCEELEPDSGRKRNLQIAKTFLK